MDPFLPPAPHHPHHAPPSSPPGSLEELWNAYCVESDSFRQAFNSRKMEVAHWEATNNAIRTENRARECDQMDQKCRLIASQPPLHPQTVAIAAQPVLAEATQEVPLRPWTESYGNHPQVEMHEHARHQINLCKIAAFNGYSPSDIRVGQMVSHTDGMQHANSTWAMREAPENPSYPPQPPQQPQAQSWQARSPVEPMPHSFQHDDRRGLFHGPAMVHRDQVYQPNAAKQQDDVTNRLTTLRREKQKLLNSLHIRE